MYCYVLSPKTQGVEVLSKDDDGEGVKAPVRYRWVMVMVTVMVSSCETGVCLVLGRQN